MSFTHGYEVPVDIKIKLACAQFKAVVNAEWWVHLFVRDLTLPLTENISSFTQANIEIFLPSIIVIVEVLINTCIHTHTVLHSSKKLFYWWKLRYHLCLVLLFENWLFLSEIGLTNVFMSNCYCGNIEFLFCTAIAVPSMQLSSASTKK